MRLRNLLLILWIIFGLVNPALANKQHKTAKNIKHKTITHTVTHTTTIKKKRIGRPKPKRVYKPKSVKLIVRKPNPIVVPATLYGNSQLASQLNAAINAVGSNAAIAVYVKSMKNGQSIYEHNISQSFVPASTLKVLTAEAALLFLKPEYRFATHLLTDAKTVKNGVLQGNLYVVLSGDPTLTYSHLLELMMSLQAQHIQAIAGNVYIDNTAYDQGFYGPGWEYKDKHYCYAAPISASIINHNCLPIRVSPAKVAGRVAIVETSSKFFYPMIKNSVITKPVHTRACSLRLSPDLSTGLTIDGCMPAGGYAWGLSYVVTDVSEYNRALFRGALGQVNVKLYGTVSFRTAPEHLSLVGVHTSNPLPLLLREMLKKSDNVIAGALFKKIGQLYTRQPGSWENGSVAVSQILSKQAGVDVSGLRNLDGSGLSPNNLTKPTQMMQVLNHAFHQSASGDFISALPIAGIDGTLKHRMGNISRKVYAKTGTISGVVSLAGYAMSADKEPLAFVIMVNGSKGMTWRYREMEDKIATALTRYKRN